MRWLRRIIIAMVVLLGSIGLAAWLYHWHLATTNRAYMAELAAAGEPLTLAQVRPSVVPPKENQLETLLSALAMLDQDTTLLKTNWIRTRLAVSPGRALSTAQCPAAPGIYATNCWPDLAQALAQNQPLFDRLHALGAHPRLDFNIPYERGMDSSFDWKVLHLSDLKKCAKYLGAAIMANLHDGQAAAAVTNQQAMLALVPTLNSQQFIISDLVGLAVARMAQGSTWSILQSPAMTETQLLTLQQDWEQLPLVSALAPALAMERVTGQITLAQWRANPEGLRSFLALEKGARESLGILDAEDGLPRRFQRQAEIFLWRFWWSYPDELRALQGYQCLLIAAREVATNGSFLPALTRQTAGLDKLHLGKIQDEMVAFLSQAADFNTLLSSSIAGLSPVINKVMTTETCRQMTITAIALQRFKLAAGHYPAHLAELVPAWLAAVPRDPVDGQPLRYRLQPDGAFLLYSVGDNGVDDGGNPNAANPNPKETIGSFSRNALDWVWPQAASADELKLSSATNNLAQ